MSDPLSPNVALLCKLGSIAQHAREMTGPSGHQFDAEALAQLLDDAAVVHWLADMEALALVPVMR